MGNWQTYAALAVVAVAVVIAIRSLVLPFFRAMKSPAKSGGCGGGCAGGGCGTKSKL